LDKAHIIYTVSLITHCLTTDRIFFVLMVIGTICQGCTVTYQLWEKDGYFIVTWLYSVGLSELVYLLNSKPSSSSQTQVVGWSVPAFTIQVSHYFRFPLRQVSDETVVI